MLFQPDINTCPYRVLYFLRFLKAGTSFKTYFAICQDLFYYNNVLEYKY